jgi:hypothetical protein
MNHIEDCELMDPTAYWAIHAGAWHELADIALEARQFSDSNFFDELEEAAEYIRYALGA